MELSSPETPIDAAGKVCGGDRILKAANACWLWSSSSSSAAAEEETDRDSWGSSEETESPKSVAGDRRRWRKKVVHSQVLKIREEDSHLGEALFAAAANHYHNLQAASRPPVDVLILTRPILPSSPLRRC